MTDQERIEMIAQKIQNQQGVDIATATRLAVLQIENHRRRYRAAIKMRRALLKMAQRERHNGNIPIE